MGRLRPGRSAAYHDRTKINLDIEWNINAALYCIIVGSPGTNKSGIHKTYLEKPLRSVEEQCMLPATSSQTETLPVRLLFDKSTTSALHQHLHDHQGEAIITTYEIKSTIMGALYGEHEVDKDVLNSLWCNSTWSKHLAGQRARVVKDSNLVLAGTTTFDAWWELFCEIYKDNDGFIDRLLTVIVRPYFPLSEDSAKAATKLQNFRTIQLERIAVKLYNAHHGSDGITYSFCREAQDFLKQRNDEANRLKNELVSRGKLNIARGESKLRETIGKVALGLHLIETYVTGGILGEARPHSSKISVTTVKRALNLVMYCRAQTATYARAYTADVATPVTSKILLMPGAVINTRDIFRRYKHEIGTMGNLACYLHGLQEEKLGSTFKCHLREGPGRRSEFFAKAAPTVAKEALSKGQITVSAYSAQFYTRSDTTSKCATFILQNYPNAVAQELLRCHGIDPPASSLQPAPQERPADKRKQVGLKFHKTTKATAAKEKEGKPVAKGTTLMGGKCIMPMAEQPCTSKAMEPTTSKEAPRRSGHKRKWQEDLAVGGQPQQANNQRKASTCQAAGSQPCTNPEYNPPSGQPSQRLSELPPIKNQPTISTFFRKNKKNKVEPVTSGTASNKSTELDKTGRCSPDLFSPENSNDMADYNLIPASQQCHQEIIPETQESPTRPTERITFLSAVEEEENESASILMGYRLKPTVGCMNLSAKAERPAHSYNGSSSSQGADTDFSDASHSSRDVLSQSMLPYKKAHE